MWQFLLRRALLMIPTFFGVTLVCFFVLRLANADPLAGEIGGGMQSGQVSQEALANLRRIYDLDKPWYVQYGKLVKRLVTFELGNRWQDGRPIRELIGEALPITLTLSFSALFLAYLIAIPLGVFSAVRQHTTADRALTLGTFILYSIPQFWMGIMFIIFLSTGHFVNCPWAERGCFPLQGWRSFENFESFTTAEKIGDVAWHLVLPLATLTYNAFASLSRYTRTGMLETIRQDYIRTARAKGLPERTVIFRHALRNSVMPLVTILGLQLPQLIAGSVIVEYIFGIRGMGLLLLEAIRLPDYPMTISLVAFTSLLVMGGMLVSDLLYAVVDPRVRAE